jgi:multidrug efflux pump subunit AcrA (membrane-fusion protein)
MRFVTRSLVGLFLFIMTLGLLGLAFATLRNAMIARDAGTESRRPAQERIFTIGVDTLAAEEVRPVLTVYGDLRSSVQLELRASSEGTLLELAPGFRDGGRVKAGDVLFRIDPAEFATALALAESDLEDVRAELADGRIALSLAREELAAAERQRVLRETALDRTRGLRESGIGTAADLEAAQLALASAEQVLTGLRLEAAQAEATIRRAEIGERRAVIARDEAKRVLDNTVMIAPFDGLLAEVDAVLGRRVSANEKLGLLIDPASLEVAFRVSNPEYARISDMRGELLPIEITAILQLGSDEVEVPGAIDRAGAMSESSQSGRLIYARLTPEAPGLLRPGDFLTVRVPEPVLHDVARVPATALDAGGRILLVGEGDRLEAVTVRILRRQGDHVLVRGVPFGRDYVTVRLPQLGPGIRIRPVRAEKAQAAVTGPVSSAEEGPVQGSLVTLSPEQRARLVAAVEADAGLPPEMKARLLSVLALGSVPRQILDEIETGARGG